jgi:peptide deformylase
VTSTLPIVQVGDPVLRARARPVTPAELASPELQTLIDQMRDTMRAAPGVGLAAPQIGQSIQLIVIEDPPKLHEGLTPAELRERERDAVPFHVLANPKLKRVGDSEVLAFEGCLSFAGFTMVVPRYRRVRVEGLDEHGKPVSIEAGGWYARILQHEVDHLRGVVCCDRMRSRTLMTADNFKRDWAGVPVPEVMKALDADRQL